MEESPKRKSLIRRYGFELFVVFLGVWLSLLAESWRQSALEARDEDTTLRRLASDMVDDTADISGDINRAMLGIQGVTWVLAQRDVGEPRIEGLAENLAHMGPCSRPGWNASEYTALKGPGRLNLISDSELRQRIVELYEGRSFLDWVHGLDCTDSEAVLDLMSPHVKLGFAPEVGRSGPDTLEWSARRHPTIEAIPEPPRLLSDRILMNRIAKLAAYRRSLLWQMEAEMEKTKAPRLEILRSVQ